MRKQIQPVAAPSAAMKRWGIVLLVGCAAVTRLVGQQSGIPITVSETAGIRRTAYPVSAQVEIPEHSLSDVGHVRLRRNGADVPAQFRAATTWPDGSVRALDVDFNASIGPRETLSYSLEAGAAVTAPAVPRGLSVVDSGESIQVGNVTFGKTASPLLRSVKYRDEDIVEGPNGFSVIDASGASHDVVLSSPAASIIKPGPLDVALRYAGEAAIGSARPLPFVITAEMPSSKTWIKMSLSVQDPDQRVRAIVFRNTLSLGPSPILWDFGTSKGTYGVFRSATETATFSRERSASASLYAWHVDAAAGGRPEQVLESDSEPIRPLWGHLQGSKEAVAFAADFSQGADGVQTLRLNGAGQITIQSAPRMPLRNPSLTVYEHFVSAPVQIGAATSPAAILAPLAVR